jgi:hypothetical protein
MATEYGPEAFQPRQVYHGLDFPEITSDTYRSDVLSILRVLADRVDPRDVNEDNTGTLLNVVTGEQETAAVLTEYISPDQHGNIFGLIYRRYYAIPEVTAAATSATIDLGITVTGRIIKAEGMVEIEAGDTFLPLPYVDPADAGDEGLGIVVTLDDIIITKNADDQDWKAGGFIAVDYTK